MVQHKPVFKQSTENVINGIVTAEVQIVETNVINANAAVKSANYLKTNELQYFCAYQYYCLYIFLRNYYADEANYPVWLQKEHFYYESTHNNIS